MNKYLIIASFMLVTAGYAGNAHSSGTPAGTTITNKATAHYTVGMSTLTKESNTITVTVVELLNNTVTWQDSAPGVTVSLGQINRVLTYLLTNTGNGDDGYTLSATGTAIGGDIFDPTVTSIYLDVNANGVYDVGTDTLYIAGTNDPTLARDAALAVFVLSTIPSTGFSDGDIGKAQLTAASKTGTGAAGTLLEGLGEGGTDAVVGPAGGIQSALGDYIVAGIVVNVVKAGVVAADPTYGTQPVPGAKIDYSITVTATGTGTAMGVYITDPTPVNTTYVSGSLKLDGVELTDGADSDKGDVGGTTPGTVRVQLDDLAGGAPARTITFQVTIN